MEVTLSTKVKGTVHTTNSRRGFLQKLGLYMGSAVAVLSLPSWINLLKSQKDAVPSDLPGEGSIFQPRENLHKR